MVKKLEQEAEEVEEGCRWWERRAAHGGAALGSDARQRSEPRSTSDSGWRVKGRRQSRRARHNC